MRGHEALSHGEIVRAGQLDVAARALDERYVEPGPLGQRRVVRKIVAPFDAGSLVRLENCCKAKTLRRLRSPEPRALDGARDGLTGSFKLQSVGYRLGGNGAGMLAERIDHC